MDGQGLVPAVPLPEAHGGGVSGAEGLVGTPVLPLLHSHHQRRRDPENSSAGAVPLQGAPRAPGCGGAPVTAQIKHHQLHG